MKSIEWTISDKGAALTGYLHEPSDVMPDYRQRPCVLVCPGGGYRVCSDREADPVALAYFARGYHVFILNYSTCENAADFQPLIELSESILRIRLNSGDLGVIPGQIAVCGFSAGGHLACSAGVLWDHELVQNRSGAQGADNRPDALILGYPVISSGPSAHEDSFRRLSGCKERCAKWDAFSLERFVRSDMPPSFLWHTVDDASVPVENTLLLIGAMRQKKVRFECHLYESGVHGMSMCTPEVGTANAHNASWFALGCDWLDTLFNFHCV